MGEIQQTSTGQVRVLEPEHVIGRTPGCSLRLAGRYVSAQHAVIRFTGDRWELRDLSSRNGSFVQGNRIGSGREVPLVRGSRIAFGKLEEEWILTDDSAPRTSVVPLDGGSPIPLNDEMIALPSADDPRVTIYRDAEGAWMLEQPESVAPLGNLQVFEIDGQSFKFSCPEFVAKTSLADPFSGLELQHLALSFSVSRDEEHVDLQAAAGGRSFDLGSYACYYLLLTLARRRLADAAEGLPETSCGWVYIEDLAHDPSMAPPQMNIDVFRIRQQFGSIGVADPGGIIERRPRTKQIRIGIGRISIATL